MHKRYWLIATGIGLVLVVVATGLWALARTEQPSGPLSEARQMLAETGARDPVRDANEVALASRLVADELQRCRSQTPGRRCTALAAALGYAQVTAARMIRCDAAGRRASRRALRGYLDRIARIDNEAAPNDQIDRPPTLPVCASG